MPYFHLTVRARYGLNPLVDRDACAELWSRLQRRFDRVLAGVLMPNHLHLVLDRADPEAARAVLSIELVALTQSRLSGRRIWDPAPQPEIIQDRHHLKRHIRYVHLNPCRAGLAGDPLEWEWSTHRDAVGAVGAPWIDLAVLNKLFGAREFPAVFHAYVSSDPSVRVGGTSLPVTPGDAPTAATLRSIAEAVLQANRAPAGSLQKRGSKSRRLAALLAHQMGGRNQVEMAEWLGIKRRALWDILSVAPTADELRAMRAAQWLLANQSRFATFPAQPFPALLPKMSS